MKTIIAGGRDFCKLNEKSYERDVHFFLASMEQVPWEITEAVSGTANGADKQGEVWAIINNISIKKFPADWSIGKHAGHVRNKQMADYAEALVAFWDGVSKGTSSMIEYAKQRNLKTKVFYYDAKA